MASRFPTPFSPGRGLWGRDPFLQLHREVNRLFDDTFRDWGEGDQRSLLAAPRLDVHEEGNSLEVSVELPGVEQKDVELSLDQDVLTIRGEKRNERKDKQAHITERSYGSFQRSIQLPFVPKAEEVRADFRDGVLTVSIPRQEQQERSRRIEIGGPASAREGQLSSAQGDQGGQGAEVGEQGDRSAFRFGERKSESKEARGETTDTRSS
jgi:HSP20 family protein